VILAAHLYILAGKMLFLLPAPDAKACAITALRYGPADGSWERGTNPPPGKCEFRVSVMPGDLLPTWVDAAPVSGDLDVAWGTQTLTMHPEKVEPAAVQGSELQATARKAGKRVRVEVKNGSKHQVVLGDAAALRGKPADDCVGAGPAAVLQPGESLVDFRPGLLSRSMQVWVSVFAGERQCAWAQALTHIDSPVK
jgi:hypothetical protein